jgi:hypothetical protein
VDHLYVIQSNVSGAVKIGRSSDPEKRLQTLQTGSPYKLRLILVVEGLGYAEKSFHERLKKYSVRQGLGEWFRYEALPELPTHIYEQLELDVVDTWWV